MNKLNHLYIALYKHINRNDKYAFVKSKLIRFWNALSQINKPEQNFLRINQILIDKLTILAEAELYPSPG